jgi:transcriptional regulator with XRE-family HTH domain
MEIGKRIQAKRQAAGMSVKQLAKKVRCSASLISQWECGILPKKLNSGAIARAKRVLKVRVSNRFSVAKAAKPSKPLTQVQRVAKDTHILRAIHGLRMDIQALRAAVARQNKKPANVIQPTQDVFSAAGSIIPAPLALESFVPVGL